MGALLRRAAGCSAALLVCVLIAAGPARGAGWTEATTVGGTAAGVPVVAADATGDVAIAYQQGEADVAGAARPAGGVFSTATPLTADGVIPVIASNPAGGVIAGWTGDAGVGFATGSAATGFSGGGTVSGAGDAPVDVSVGIDDAGNRWLAWVDDGGTVRAVRTGTGAAVGISPDPPVETPGMAVAPGGAVTIVWVRRTETEPGNDVRVVTRVERATVGTTSIDILAFADGTLAKWGDGDRLRRRCRGRQALQRPGPDTEVTPGG